MRIGRLGLVLGLAVVIAACGDAAVTLPPPAATPTPTPLAATPEPTPTDTPTIPPNPILGDWHRAQTCPEMLAAFEAAGLAESHRNWLQGNFYEGGEGPAEGDPCAGASGPLEHAHFFTPEAGFGSLDHEGNVVDGGDFALDGALLTFPSHSAEFGYDGPIEVGFTVDGDVATFDVMIPAECVENCAEAYAWALSAFASGPWNRGGIP